MPLIGVIEPGSVPRILRSVEHAGADVLILFEQGQRSGHVLFEKGELVMARLDDLRDREALAELESWSSGHYSLLKRARKEAEVQGHVLLNGLDLATRRGLERWLKRNKWGTSIVGHPRHAQRVVSYIQPDVVLMNCPRLNLGLSCRALSEELQRELHVPPLLVVVESGGQKCPEPGEDCVRIDGSPAALERVMRGQWPGTRLGVRRASQEQTARVQKPLHPVAEVDPGEDLAVRDLLPMLVALLLGSSLIWGTWWLVNF